jgi:hypothetical protein
MKRLVGGDQKRSLSFQACRRIIKSETSKLTIPVTIQKRQNPKPDSTGKVQPMTPATIPMMPVKVAVEPEHAGTKTIAPLKCESLQVFELPNLHPFEIRTLQHKVKKVKTVMICLGLFSSNGGIRFHPVPIFFLKNFIILIARHNFLKNLASFPP